MGVCVLSEREQTGDQEWVKPYSGHPGDLGSRNQRFGVSGLLEPGEVWLNVGYWSEVGLDSLPGLVG